MNIRILQSGSKAQGKGDSRDHMFMWSFEPYSAGAL